MTQLEQAIYTSAKTSDGDGYQLVGQSPGVLDIDARQLAIWCPSHDALPAEGPQRSINFFRLPSGVHCVSQTIAAGQEYSGRTGPRVYTHCLLASPEALARFSNDPFALLNAALCTGELEPQDVIPRQMSPLKILGKASAVNRLAIETYCDQFSTQSLAGLVASLLAEPRLALVDRGVCEKAFAAALACIPVECRTEFSFTTALKHSSRRPFRLMSIGSDDPQHLSRRFGIASTTLGTTDRAEANAAASSFANRWAALIARLLAAGNLSGIAAIMIPPRPGLTLETLDGLAAKIGPAIAPDSRDGGHGNSVTVAHAHASHSRKRGSDKTGVAMEISARSTTTPNLPPEEVEKLETLDDAVFEAIAGKPGAMEQLQKLWPEVRSAVNSTSLEESRIQYLEFAMKVWNQQEDSLRAPEKAMAALDVMCVILDT